ncbi:prenyltransferase/squalene oxidase repeat-containing protein [Plantactinospora solaniradicis]|uniref:Prenyltransferase/squalene oxidase repeat-containing protein n=1 Tax=Plantactinospora solaniradicis TaxID=1723736 RepID=A0ABW1K8A2_9ACTN
MQFVPIKVDIARPLAAGVDIVAATRELLAGLARQPWGQVSPSIYETGRLVTLAPWLIGHAERLRYLLDSQRPDGGWGAPGGYALVPTLSATEALLATLRGIAAGRQPAVGRADLASAADRGLRVLHRWLRADRLSIPDTPAVDLIIPALVASINQQLDEVRESPLTGLDAWRGEARLGIPKRMDSSHLDRIRQALIAGARAPEKLLHAWEVAGNPPHGATGIHPASPGTVGASPAATAAWLGGTGLVGSSHSVHQALAYLETVARQLGGPVPCAVPITVFERGWVLSGLARAGVPLAPPPELVSSLAVAIGPAGTPAGPGLPADADTTSVALHALVQLGTTLAPESLWGYEMTPYFCTWPGEDGISVTTNAHVLDAFGAYLTTVPDVAGRYQAAVVQLSAWLVEQQLASGEWGDRWHASPYYATACCVLALDQFGCGPSASASVARAIEWVLATQRSDGSWGRWTGTVEETAYAMHILLAPAGLTERRHIAAAAIRGYTYLQETAGRQDDPPLWHDKDLYCPSAIVRAATLAALHLAQSRPDLMTSRA